MWNKVYAILYSSSPLKIYFTISCVCTCTCTYVLHVHVQVYFACFITFCRNINLAYIGDNNYYIFSFLILYTK